MTIAEEFVMNVYKELSNQLRDLYGADCYLPVKYTREYTAVLDLIIPETPIPSLFNREDVRKVVEDIPDKEFGSYPQLKYGILIQFCWKSPDMLDGFFKIRPQYPWNENEGWFKTNPVPMVVTDAIIKYGKTNELEPVVKGLLNIIRTI